MRERHAAAGDTDALHAYLRAIGKIPRLTAAEERALGERIRVGGDEDALRRLVEANLRFVVSYAKRYRGLGVPFLDLIHEGNLGLIEAARRFDPFRNVKFITYAVWWIRQAIVHALAEQTRSFALPAKLSGVAARFGRDVAALTAQLDRAPTSREIADDLDLSEGEVDALLRISGDDVSLNEPIGAPDGDGPELADTIAQEVEPAADDALIREALAEELRAALSELDAKEREVMQLRYGLRDDEPRTLQQIGDLLHLSRERIRQIESRAIEKLRRSAKGRELRTYLN